MLSTVSWRCHDRKPQAGGASKEIYLLTVIEVGSPRSRGWQVSLEASPGLAGGRGPCVCPPVHASPLSLCVHISLLIRTPGRLDQGPHKASFSLNPPLRPVSK